MWEGGLTYKSVVPPPSDGTRSYSQPQAGTKSYVKFAQNGVKPESRDFLPFCLLTMPLVIANVVIL